MPYEPTIAIEVRIWGERVGALTRRRAGYGFEYSPEWKRSGVELSPVLLPTASTRRVFEFPGLRSETFYGLPPMLADALPDRFGNQIVDAWLAAQGVAPTQITALDRLAYLGGRGMGALEFVPDKSPAAPNPTALDLSVLVETARAVVGGTLDTERETLAALGQIISVGTSAGGARAKAVVNIDDVSHEIRPGHTMPGPTENSWILKFDGMGADQQLGQSQKYTRIEYAYSLMASAAGIDMAETRLLDENGRRHFLSRRFDRESGRRIHMQTLCGIAAIDFNLPGTNDYAQLFLTADQLGLGADARTEIFRRMAFNVAASNHDDHSKNHSFLLREGGGWELSPAYDVTFAKDATNIWLERHLMSVNGKFTDITRQDLLAVADRFAVPGAKAALAAITDALASWPDFATLADLDVRTADEVAREFSAL